MPQHLPKPLDDPLCTTKEVKGGRKNGEGRGGRVLLFLLRFRTKKKDVTKKKGVGNKKDILWLLLPTPVLYAAPPSFKRESFDEIRQSIGFGSSLQILWQTNSYHESGTQLILMIEHCVHFIFLDLFRRHSIHISTFASSYAPNADKSVLGLEARRPTLAPSFERAEPHPLQVSEDLNHLAA